MGKLIIQAYNVHQGGGKILLDTLLGFGFPGKDWVLLVDSRMRIPSLSTGSCQIRKINPSIWSRLKAEWWLARNAGKDDTVLCFGNLPPIFKSAARVQVFLQNRDLIEPVCLSEFHWKIKLRISVERFWLNYKAVNSDQFIVQTPSMKCALETWLLRHSAKNLQSGTPKKKTATIQVLPFISNADGYERRLTTIQQETEKEFDFIYVASGEPHKNHHRLIEAWCILAQEGVFPSLCLTLDKDRFSVLCEWIEKKSVQYRLKLQIFNIMPHGQILQLYGRVKAMIYPSTFESFGLPLVEARQKGLPILAPELDYVRDLIDPDQTFDPESVISISRSVKRFLNMDDSPLHLLNAEEFAKYIILQ